MKYLNMCGKLALLCVVGLLFGCEEPKTTSDRPSSSNDGVPEVQIATISVEQETSANSEKMATPAANQLKIAIVDMDYVLSNYSAVSKAHETVKAKQQSIEAEFKKSLTEFESAASAFQQTAKSMTREQQMQKADELSKQRQKLEETEQVLNQEMMDFERNANEGINNEVKKVVEAYRKNHDLDLILERTKFGTVMAAANELDITADILDALEKTQAP